MLSILAALLIRCLAAVGLIISPIIIIIDDAVLCLLAKLLVGEAFTFDFSECTRFAILTSMVNGKDRSENVHLCLSNSFLFVIGI